MKLPAIQGIIRRRILLNFRVDPARLRPQLPAGFELQLQSGWAVAGVCLIRLEQMRPCGWPALLGISSENAAHRMAVSWREPSGETRTGVYVPRRDTDSRLNQMAGGRFFPGEQNAAEFTVHEQGEAIDFAMRSMDGTVTVEFQGAGTTAWPGTSIFGSLAEASSFFQAGSLGYSARKVPGTLDGIELRVQNWQVSPLAVTQVRSSYFSDATQFPAGSVEFDNALVMRDIPHEWRGVPPRTDSSAGL